MQQSMRMMSKIGVLLVAVQLSSCATTGDAPPPAETPNFVFAVPSTAPPVKPPMTVAILQPKSSGSLFVENVYGAAPGMASNRTRYHVSEMLQASQTDLERIIIAKGFPSAGTFPTMDEMTFSQKEKSSLMLLPDMEVNVGVANGGFGQPQTATVSGTVSLQFLEPMSKEKVWVKRIQLQPFTVQVKPDPVSFADIVNKVPKDPNAIGQNAMVQLLNAFYAATMSKIWDQLDPREIQNLRGDADKLKGKTNYRG